jgi:hypothetical protein
MQLIVTVDRHAEKNGAGHRFLFDLSKVDKS